MSDGDGGHSKTGQTGRETGGGRSEGEWPFGNPEMNKMYLLGLRMGGRSLVMRLELPRIPLEKYSSVPIYNFVGPQV